MVWTKRAKAILGMTSKINMIYHHALQSTAFPLCVYTLRSLLERKMQGVICYELALQNNELKIGVQSILDKDYKYYIVIW